MDRLIFISIVLCVFVINSNLIIAHEAENTTLEPSEALTATISSQDNESDYDNDTNDNEPAEVEQRSIASHTDLESSVDKADRHEAFRKRAKPLKSIFMGIYKNYKSTYLGNKTFAEYKRTLRTNAQDEENASDAALVESKEKNTQLDADIVTLRDTDESRDVTTEVYNNNEEYTTESESKLAAKSENTKYKKKKQRGRKRSHRRRKKHSKRYLKAKKESTLQESPIYNYDFGPGVNMSLDLNNEIVKLHLGGENLRDILQGRWLQNKNEGRGKKYDMITKVLPLFIIPFLIQSAVVPFLVTKLKLLLMKSILVGKLAIFLLVISAIKNSNKMMQTYEVAPSYWAGEPSRRSELAAAASAAAYNGYRVEGKPTAWIN